MKKETIFCDICEKEISNAKAKEIQIIFTTDQTEGRSCEPYLSNQVIDICKDCMDKVLKGNYIFAHGAQGYNTYYFNDQYNKDKI